MATSNERHRRNNNRVDGQPHLGGLLSPRVPVLSLGAKEASGMQEARSAPSGSNSNAEGDNTPTVSKGDGTRRGAPSSALPLEQKQTKSGTVHPNAYIVVTGDATVLDELWAARAPSPVASAESASTSDVEEAAAEAAAAVAAAMLVDDMSSPAQRRLRTCSGGEDFRVLSTVYSSASGCYSETGSETDAYVNADSDRIVFPAHLTASSSGNEVFTWVAGEVLSYTENNSPIVNPACVSDEVWEVNSHPADVESWSCLIGGALVKFSAESFGAECGCSENSSSSSSSSSVAAEDSTPSPASETASPESASSSTTDSTPVECEADSIVVTFPHLNEFGGCFQQEAGGEDEVSSFLSQTSEHVGGVEAVFSAFFDENGEDVRWVAGASADSSSESRIVPVCLSDNSAFSAHPAESTWLCDFDGTGAYMPVSQANFQVECGCDSEGTPTPAPGSGSRESTPSTSSPSGADSAGDGRPTPAPTFQPFAIDRLGTSGAAPCAPVSFSVLGMVGVLTMVGFVRRLVGGY